MLSTDIGGLNNPTKTGDVFTVRLETSPGLESPSSLRHFSNISSALLDYREKGYLCDISLVAGDCELSAHSVILAAASPVFRAAIRPNTNRQRYRIYLRDFEFETVQIALNFIYTGSLHLSPEYATNEEQLTKLVENFAKLGLRFDECAVTFIT